MAFANATEEEKVWMAIQKCISQRVDMYVKNGVEIICNFTDPRSHKTTLQKFNGTALSENNRFLPFILQRSVDLYNKTYDKHGMDKARLKYTLTDNAILLVNAGFFKNEGSQENLGIKILPFIDYTIDELMMEYLIKDIQKVDLTAPVKSFYNRLDNKREFFVFGPDGQLISNPNQASIMAVSNNVDKVDELRILNNEFERKGYIMSGSGYFIQDGQDSTILSFKQELQALDKAQEAEKARKEIAEE